MRVVCGWCNHPTPPGCCDYCGRDPVLPWLQRAMAVPLVESEGEGRPALDAREIRLRFESARRQLVAAGREPTVEAIAEALERSPRTIRTWKARFGL